MSSSGMRRRRHIPENDILYSYRRENLKSYNLSHTSGPSGREFTSKIAKSIGIEN
jgi:hypothetical protein